MFRAHVLVVRRTKIVVYSLWYQHTYRWLSRAQIERGLDVFHSIGGLLVKFMSIN